MSRLTTAVGHQARGTSGRELATSDPEGAAERYAVSGRKRFWQEIFRRELAYLVEHLKGCSDILSVGCGPAVIEGGLAKRGFNVTGLDVSQEALNRAPDSVRTVAAKAEDMPFPRSSFDAVVYVASLQFIDDYRKAIEKSVYVLRSGGRIIVMLLNPKSEFFKRKSLDPDSYVRRIRHTDLKKIEHVIADNYAIRTEYFLGVKGDAVLADRVAGNAVLYVVSGTKKSLTPASVNA